MLYSRKRWSICFVLLLIFTLLLTACAPIQTGTAAQTTTLRLAVSLTPQELASLQQSLTVIESTHPEWEIVLEVIPQASVIEKINTQLAANDLPDLLRVQGLQAQTWIRQDAFLDLSPLIEQSQFDLSDFYDGPLDQFRWKDVLWGLPDTAAPEVVFYNKAMFDAAGLAYPTDDRTYDDMRIAARKLTLDANGKNADDPAFDSANIVQWGWNGGLTYFWQRHLVRGWGGDFCENADCTLMNFSKPATVAAVQWWADFTAKDHATLYDPYGGSQTGVPGDPLIAGKAAMGYNGFFAVGQLNSMATIDYDIVQPLLGENGNRYTPLSVNGYVIAANSAHPAAAWALAQELLSQPFLEDTWGKPGHAVPARRSAAQLVINLDHAPANQPAILAAMEVGEVFKPYTSAAFATYGATAEWFVKAMEGEVVVADALAAIEKAANETLAGDRE